MLREEERKLKIKHICGRGGGGGGGPGGGGGARGPLPLSSPGRRRGPYLGPPRLGPWTACGRSMAAPNGGEPAR